MRIFFIIILMAGIFSPVFPQKLVSAKSQPTKLEINQKYKRGLPPYFMSFILSMIIIYDYHTLWIHTFIDGKQYFAGKLVEIKVRNVRAF